ncbi:MAG: hypothetical protein WHT06_06655 [Desulfobacterales bacterium]
MSRKKRYTIKTACPQCGCTTATVMTAEELEKRYGHVPNFDLECGECLAQFSAPAAEACPEWDAACRLKR